ncbi:hypothetical protein LF65_04690 [Clostridium beijerinckii]|uniref:Phosphatidylglycerol lysyltransferase C-terminal domain-containing protein n=1 Tax=Clostridium beijerinckii TaxID=1520 RepID=A0A0B5QJX1_CLOBE|nr:phosphatidylglycerol lysyltransferase domain-containing protein [Clostridium beijerinckii]AJH01221.1 hypothetical protein LF65_04690 [Clostridium beijerinckii]
MKYKKYHILSITLVMIVLIMQGIFGLLSYIDNHSNSNINYVYIINFVLLMISFLFIIKGLLQRLRWALIINIVILALLVVTNLMEDVYFEFDIFLLSYILLSLIIHRKWFKSKSYFIKLKIGICLACFLIAANIILNVIFVSGFNDINMFINLCLFLIIIRLTLEPKSLRIGHSYEDKLKVQDLLRKFSTNPVSAIILEDDKQYFFPRFCEGVIGYTVVNNIAIVAGEPICSDKEIENILSEFKNFCSDNSLSICFCQVSKKCIKVLKNAGFIVQEYGKEAIIYLDTYTISGSKTAKIRWANNKMDKLGVKTTEYKPLVERNHKIEEQIMGISHEWLTMKKSGELSFMLGTVSLDKPFDRRYFIASNKEGDILGFVVCFPYGSKKGYFVDITRRSKDAPLGIMEKLTIDICKILKEDEVKEVSLGLAPLADIQGNSSVEGVIIHKIFKFMYKYMNSFYGFKALYDYKKKYNPSAWESKFIAFSSEASIISIGYAMIKAKHPQGVRKLLFDRLLTFIK